MKNKNWLFVVLLIVIAVICLVTAPLFPSGNFLREVLPGLAVGATIFAIIIGGSIVSGKINKH